MVKLKDQQRTKPRVIPLLEKSLSIYILIFWFRDCSGAGNKNKTEPAFEVVSGEIDSSIRKYSDAGVFSVREKHRALLEHQEGHTGGGAEEHKTKEATSELGFEGR